MPTSKRLRFEVLRRDNHTCRYCGGTAPETVDHFLRAGLTPDDLVSHIDIALRKPGIAKSACFRYFCGICYRVLSQRQEAARAILSTQED